MKKTEHDADLLFKKSVETHTEPLPVDVWANIEIHLKKKQLKEKESSAIKNDKRPIVPVGKSAIHWDNNGFKKIIPNGLKSVWKIFGSFISPEKGVGIETSSSNEEISNLGDIDKLFKDAASNYPLNVWSSDWKKLNAKMSNNNDSAMMENRLMKFFSPKTRATARCPRRAIR